MRETTKIGILSLGCPRNLVDSENILGRLNLKGYTVADLADADVALINTCAFIDEAKAESIEAILDAVELKRQGRLKKIIVYGCLAQRYRHSLASQLPEVDAFVGRVSLNHQLKRFPLTPRHYAYLKICEGCINNCSFCVIPKIKGRFCSLEQAAIFKKVTEFSRQGISELNIIGQDITGYGIDLYGAYKLSQLLEEICRRAKNIGWIRLLYLNPQRIDERLLEVIQRQRQICKYIDLPIQHINRRILKLMRRQANKASLLRLLEKIRKAIPGVGLRTAIIVGFPSETDREFRELLDFIKEARFERLGAFIYSQEEGTPAYQFKGQIPQQVKEERFALLMSAQQEISRQINQRFLDSTLEVLVEERQGPQLYLCRSQYDAPEVDGLVYLHSQDELKSGDFLRARITDTLEYDLVAEPCGVKDEVF